MRFVHDALGLDALDYQEMRIQLHPQAAVALVILDQAYTSARTVLTEQ